MGCGHSGGQPGTAGNRQYWTFAAAHEAPQGTRHAPDHEAVHAAEERRKAIETLQREKLSLNAMAARLNAESVSTTVISSPIRSISAKAAAASISAVSCANGLPRASLTSIGTKFELARAVVRNIEIMRHSTSLKSLKGVCPYKKKGAPLINGLRSLSRSSEVFPSTAPS